MTIKEKAKVIIDHYGVLHQLKHFQSEVFELNEAILEHCHDEYTHIPEVNNKLKEHIKEEIGDVQFMLNQFKEYYGIADFNLDFIMDGKANRQLERMANENNIR